VTHDHLWAPWRLAFIKSERPKPDEESCFLCRYRDQTNDEENLVVSRTDETIIVLNRFPYNNGHLLIAPLEHKADLEDLTEEELLACQLQIRKFSRLISQTMNPEGFNIGLNLGLAAGAGLPGHLHWHVVPRWSGDTNFMPVIADTKVIPQSLQALFELLRNALREPEEESP
jgi:ATP adenylyltransferase